jgi:hypothetical protein
VTVYPRSKDRKEVIVMLIWYPELFCLSLAILLMLGLAYWSKYHEHHV